MTDLEMVVRTRGLKFGGSSLTGDPLAFYQEVYRSKDRAFKSACVWDPERIA